jgi:hypothetical protein
MKRKNSRSIKKNTGTNLRKYHFLNPISGFRVIALIGMAFFVLNSCDLFGQDDEINAPVYVLTLNKDELYFISSKQQESTTRPINFKHIEKATLLTIEWCGNPKTKKRGFV